MKIVRKYGLLLVIAIVFLILLPACSEKNILGEEMVKLIAISTGEMSTSTSQVNRQEDSTKNDVVRISAIGIVNADELIKGFTPFMNYLNQKTGKKFEFVYCENYDKVIEGFEKDTIDFASLGPVTYVTMRDQKKMAVEPLVRPLESGKDSYTSIVFVKKDSPIQSMSELRGKKMAFGDRLSTAANLFPRYIIYNSGAAEDTWAGSQQLGSQDNIFKGVLSGDFDAGASKSTVYKKNNTDGKFRQIGESDKISTFAYTARSDMDPQLKEAIKQALLELKDPEILTKIEKPFTGFIEAKDEDYNSVRDVLKLVSID